jgi:hypothetical protein
MRISQNTASAAAYTPAPAAPKGRELSDTQKAVQAQLAHNKQQAKVDADKLAKVSGKPVTNDTAKAGSAASQAGGAAAGTTAPTTSTKAAANAKSAETTDTQAAQKKPAKPQTVFEKQHAHNQAMAKIHSAMLDKVAKPETPKTDTAQPSAAAAQAATAKYMENSGQSTGSTTTHFRA